MAVSFSSGHFTVCREAPKINATAAEESPRQPAKRQNELAAIAALESGSREFEEQFLKPVLRMRRRFEAGISQDGCQGAPPTLNV
jgi:hypothetical protein